MFPVVISCGGGGGGGGGSGGGVVEKYVGASLAQETTVTELPHSGVTSSQCYQAGSDTLVPCGSAAALDLSGPQKQDGMRFKAMEFSSVGSFSKDECVKDNITGLVWEGKPDSDPRSASNLYTNFGDKRSGDASAYVAYVNAKALCGSSNWRIPTRDELQNLVNYGGLKNPDSKLQQCPSTKSEDTYCELPSPRIAPDWFANPRSNLYWECTNTEPPSRCQMKSLSPNTQNGWYWTSTGLAGYYGDAWSVKLSLRSEKYPVRLVRKETPS